LVPLTILPSAIWRSSMLVTDDRGFVHAFTGGRWYLMLLSVLSMSLGLLTVGLVRPWGTSSRVGSRSWAAGWCPRTGQRKWRSRAARR
jgi:uncharacterized membrane protein YjgN (DUF898 family)